MFFLETLSDTHLATDNLAADLTAVPWEGRALGLGRGSGVTASSARNTVTGPTLGVEVGSASRRFEWISPPVAADVTISGTITANIWASENNMSANVAINVVVEVLRANATATRNSNTIVEIGRSARVIEVAVTTRAVNNFTFTPTSTVVNRGDRLRVRIFGDDVGTMATGFTFDASWNGTTAAADGDSYCTFTETIAFESAPGFGQINSGTLNATGYLALGDVAGNEMYAGTFTAPGDTLTEVKVTLGKSNAPTDNLIIEVWNDSGGNPGSSVGTVATVAGTGLTTAEVQYTYSGLSIAVTPSATYWLVFRRSTAVNATNFYRVSTTTDFVTGPSKKYNGSSWSTISLAEFLWVISATSSSSVTTVYLTDTASAVATASVDREAWTSRGAGVQTDVVNTAAGWTAPIQLTDTAGGTVVDWFTRPLTAFTLTGMAVANLRALESNAAANASLRCQIARVEGDGTSPTVWADWAIAPTSTDNGELTTSEVARTANVSGDDLAITDGQRLRIRVYADDYAGGAMATAHTVTLYYAGTSGGASGDSYVTFGQTLTEYSAAAPAVFPFVNAPVFGRWP